MTAALREAAGSTPTPARPSSTSSTSTSRTCPGRRRPSRSARATPHPYDGEVAAADAIVGDLLDHLRAPGVYDEALVVVTSDHGEGLGDHGEEQHSILLYREAIQVPLLVKLPGAPTGRGRRVTAPAQLADVAPDAWPRSWRSTGPRHATARSLLRLAAPRRRALYAETLYPRLHLGWSELGSVVDGRWHFIHGPRPELYDLARDPGERRTWRAQRGGRGGRLRRALERPARGPVRPPRLSTRRRPRGSRRSDTSGWRGPSRAASPAEPPRHAAAARADEARASDWPRRGRLADAEAVLAEVVKAQPANVEAWIRLGEMLVELGRPADAAAAYSAALARAGLELPDVRVLLGHAPLRAGRLDEARRRPRASRRRCRRRRPSCSPASRWRAAASTRRGAGREARRPQPAAGVQARWGRRSRPPGGLRGRAARRRGPPPGEGDRPRGRSTTSRPCAPTPSLAWGGSPRPRRPTAPRSRPSRTTSALTQPRGARLRSAAPRRRRPRSRRWRGQPGPPGAAGRGGDPSAVGAARGRPGSDAEPRR